MKIGISGCTGRMGLMVLEAVIAHPDCTLAGAITRQDDPTQGTDIGILLHQPPTGVVISTDPEQLIREVDAVIDFSNPAHTLKCAALAAKHHKILVSGTTGLDTDAQKEMRRHAESTPIVWSANMSIGVNLLIGLVERTAALLDESYDIEVVEMHHRHKVDAPSGTALALGEAAAAGRGITLQDHSVLSREGITGARKEGTIGFATLRGGDVIGDHTVIFAGAGERIELTHKSSSRTIYAKGAVRAALWAQKRSSGLYTMRDVLAIGA